MVLILILIIGVIYLILKSNNTKKSSNQTSVKTTTSVTSATAAIAKTPESRYDYPTDQYSKRLSKNPYGTFYPSSSPHTLDSDVCPGAIKYSGYHTGDDLETFVDEKNSAVSVHSIYNGTVLKAQNVSGYGGIIVILYNINGQDYTAYFGHIDLSTAQVKSGSYVNTGDKLAELAAACSGANDNVRKHLHFAIHRGSQIDYKGYVTTKSALGAWVDPKSFLENLNTN